MCSDFPAKHEPPQTDQLSGAAGRVGCDLRLGFDSSHPDLTPERARVGSDTSQRCLPASRQNRDPTHLEGLQQMRLQTVTTPDATHTGFAASHRGHRTRAPVDSVGWFLPSFPPRAESDVCRSCACARFEVHLFPARADPRPGTACASGRLSWESCLAGEDFLYLAPRLRRVTLCGTFDHPRGK